MFCSRNLIQNYILNSAAFIGSVHTSYNLIIYTSIELNRIGLEQNIAQQKLCLISKDGDRFIEIDNEFHRLIFECAGKMWSYRFYRRTNGSL